MYHPLSLLQSDVCKSITFIAMIYYNIITTRPLCKGERLNNVPKFGQCSNSLYHPGMVNYSGTKFLKSWGKRFKISFYFSNVLSKYSQFPLTILR